MVQMGLNWAAQARWGEREEEAVMDDFDAYAAGATIHDIVDRRSARGKRLAKRFDDLPKGLTWVQFLQREEIADLCLDFITACEMFEAYQQQA
jgi:hypothetical protein